MTGAPCWQERHLTTPGVKGPRVEGTFWVLVRLLRTSGSENSRIPVPVWKGGRTHNLCFVASTLSFNPQGDTLLGPSGGLSSINAPFGRISTPSFEVEYLRRVALATTADGALTESDSAGGGMPGDEDCTEDGKVCWTRSCLYSTRVSRTRMK